jgi:hypothetical protein
MGSTLFLFIPQRVCCSLKLVILILISLAILITCQGRPSLTILKPVVEPFIIDLAKHEIDQSTVDASRQRMVFFLVSNPYTEYDTGSQLNLYLSSSRQFEQPEFTLVSGENYQSQFFYQLRSASTSVRCLLQV